MKANARVAWIAAALCCGCGSPKAGDLDASTRDDATPTPAALFGALEGTWDVTFTRSEFMPSTIEVRSATATATALIWEDVRPHQVSDLCTRRTRGYEVVLTYHEARAAFDVSYVTVATYAGMGCADLALPTGTLVRGSEQPTRVEVPRQGDAVASLFGVAGGSWSVALSTLGMGCTVDARDGGFTARVPRTHRGDVTIRASLSGRMFTGTSTDGGEFVALRR